SRYSSINFIVIHLQFIQFANLLQILEYNLSLGLIQRADGKPYVDDHVIAHLSFRHVGQIDLLDDAAKADSSSPHDRIIFGCNTEYFPRNSQTHYDCLLYSRAAATT